jgi:signal transduction histidine kinase
MAHFEAIAGADKGRSFVFTGDVTAIGRHPDNAAALNDTAASRFHAQVIRRGEVHFVVDLGSTHGTFVNEVRVNRELMINDKDRVRIGSTELIFHLGTPEDRTPTSTEPIDGNSTQPRAVDLPNDTVAFTIPVDAGSGARAISEQYAKHLSRVADAIGSELDLDRLLGTLMDTVLDVFRAERGVIMLFEERGGGDLTRRVTRPEDGEFEVSRTIVDYAIESRSSLLVSDTSEDQRFSGAESVMAQSIRSAICSPFVSREHVLGVLYIDTQSQQMAYRREDLALLNIIAANAAITIENAMLVREKVEAERLAAMGVAIAGISHYAKNILTGITGASGLIQQAFSTDDLEMAKEVWPILQRSNVKIAALVRDMLTYSKPREPNWQSGNLNDVLREIHEGQSARALEMNVDLALNLDEMVSESTFDPQSMMDALLNIVGNAVEACEGVEQARVEVRSEHLTESGQIRISIVDNGPGIPPDLAKKIFDPFFSTKGSKGTGLGLAVTRKTVEEHHGKLVLESAPGGGTIFRVTLPVQPVKG